MKWGGARDPVQNVVHMMAQMSEADSPGHKIVVSIQMDTCINNLIGGFKLSEKCESQVG